MKAVFFDCSSGASGDMILGALVDAGAPPETVLGAVEALGIDGWSVRFGTVAASGVRAVRADVRTSRDLGSRSYRDVVALLRGSRLPPNVLTRALTAFELLGRAEGRIHGVEPDDVHFHEVGSLDAIVDVVGCSAALEHFGPEKVIVSPIATGSGEVTSAHGSLPLPAPAVTEILVGTGARLFGRGSTELITPTGAAILVAAAHSFGELPAMALDATGYGAGTQDLPWPNVVRVFVGSVAEGDAGEDAVVVEANLDDMSPELAAHVLERLLRAGAQDAWFTPIVMKKGRPAFTLSALASPDVRARVVDVLFEETTTFGVRWRPVSREALDRHWIETDVEGHAVRVKVAERHGRVVSLAPEYTDALAAAEALKRPLRHVYSDALRAAENILEGEQRP